MSHMQLPDTIETSSNSKGDIDICHAGGGDMIADLSGTENALAIADEICRRYNEFPVILETLRELAYRVEGYQQTGYLAQWDKGLKLARKVLGIKADSLIPQP